jgi:hypothetical protein
VIFVPANFADGTHDGTYDGTYDGSNDSNELLEG